MAKKKVKKDFDTLINDYKEFVSSADNERGLNPISTGSLSLDICTGIGGIPRYRWSNIWGPKSSGKTTIALNICKEIIAKGGMVLYIDMEAGLDFKYIKFIVGDIKDNFILVQPETSEQAFEIAEAGIESNNFDLIVFDSIGALAPKKEKDDEFSDANVALVARQLGKFLRRNSSGLKHSDKTAFLFINQLRADIGSYYSNTKQPGGYQLEHFLSMEIRLFSARKIKKNEEILGTATSFTISKNKCAIPYRSAELFITFGIGIDTLKDALLFAERLGVLKKRGAFYYLDELNIGQGVDNAIDYLSEHEEALDNIREVCYNLIIEGGVEIDTGSDKLV